MLQSGIQGVKTKLSSSAHQLLLKIVTLVRKGPVTVLQATLQEGGLWALSVLWGYLRFVLKNS